MKAQITLRDWQIEGMEIGMQALTERDVCTIKAAPGSGKTIFAIEMFKRAKVALGIDKIIYLVPSDSLRTQSRVTAQECGLKLRDKAYLMGMAGVDGFSETYQSLRANMAKIQDYTQRYKCMIVLDEAHHISDEESWGEIVKEACIGASKIVVSTATPWTPSGQEIPYCTYVERDDGKYIKPDVEYTKQDGIGDGILRSVLFSGLDLERVEINGKEVDFTYAEKIRLKHDYMYNKAAGKRVTEDFVDPRDEHYSHLVQSKCVYNNMLKEAYVAVDKQVGGKLLVVCSTIKHALDVFDNISIDKKDKGVMLVTGNRSVNKIKPRQSSEEKASSCTIKQSVSMFKGLLGTDQEIDIIVSVLGISEGVDIPELSTLCILSNIKTDLFFTQVVGRIERKKKNDTVNEAACIFLKTERTEELVKNFMEPELSLEVDQSDIRTENDSEGDSDGGTETNHTRQEVTSAEFKDRLSTFINGESIDPELVPYRERALTVLGAENKNKALLESTIMKMISFDEMLKESTAEEVA